MERWIQDAVSISGSGEVCKLRPKRVMPLSCLPTTLVIMLALAGGSRGSEQGVTARDIAEGIEYHMSLIRDVEMKYIERWAVGGKPVAKWRATWVWCPASGREFYEKVDFTGVHLTEVGGNAPMVTAFDGERTMIWDKAGRSGRVKSTKRNTDFPTGSSPKVLMSGQAMIGIPWYQWARMDAVKLEGRETVAGRECYVLAGPMHVAVGIAVKAWFDPNAGLMLRKCEMSRNGKPWVSYDSIELEQFADGIWLPVKGRMQGTTKAKETSIGWSEVDKLSVKVNQGLPKDFFVLRWPKGLAVYDYDLKQPFFVGGGPEGAALRVDSIAEEAMRKAVRPPPRASEAEEQPETAGCRWLVAVAYVGGTLLLIWGVVLLTRRRAGGRR